MTNFERIKQMSVREMAQLLCSIHNDLDEYIRLVDDKVIYDEFCSMEDWLLEGNESKKVLYSSAQ